jgi:hypothetical protein
MLLLVVLAAFLLGADGGARGGPRAGRPRDWPAQPVRVMRPATYDPRIVLVETSPEGAMLDLFYVRSNFQKRYEQAESPARVRLPPRVEAGPRDALMVRAFREGYRQKEASLRVQSGQDRIVLELEPLPNTLVAASHTYLAGRGSLAFLAKESLTVRVQQRDQGFNVILAETAVASEIAGTFTGMKSPLVEDVETLQLGEDLLVEVRMPTGRRSEYELRSRQTRDELRDLYSYSVELVPTDGGIDAVRRAREALARVRAEDVAGCARVFDDALREELDAEALARALAPRGTFTDPYLRAAMKRLVELTPDARVQMLDGSTFTSSPIELSAAMSQAAQARVSRPAARLRARDRAPADVTTRCAARGTGETSPEAFLAALRSAEQRETSCREVDRPEPVPLTPGPRSRRATADAGRPAGALCVRAVPRRSTMSSCWPFCCEPGSAVARPRRWRGLCSEARACEGSHARCRPSSSSTRESDLPRPRRCSPRSSSGAGCRSADSRTAIRSAAPRTCSGTSTRDFGTSRTSSSTSCSSMVATACCER